eukprot:6177819-Pleurochrysis_carterae.AAC.1
MAGPLQAGRRACGSCIDEADKIDASAPSQGRPRCAILSSKRSRVGSRRPQRSRSMHHRPPRRRSRSVRHGRTAAAGKEAGGACTIVWWRACARASGKAQDARRSNALEVSKKSRGYGEPRSCPSPCALWPVVCRIAPLKRESSGLVHEYQRIP